MLSNGNIMPRRYLDTGAARIRQRQAAQATPPAAYVPSMPSGIALPFASANFSVVYHIACMNHWRYILPGQAAAIRANKNIAGIYLSVGGCDPTNEIFIRDSFGVPVEIRQVRGGVEACEHPAMVLVDEIAAQVEHPSLYLHTKGASRDDVLNRQWREYMNGFVAEADHWSAFLMASGYNACGRLLMTGPEVTTTPYFGGNFWMARSDYLRSLIPYQDQATSFGQHNRHLAEGAVNRQPEEFRPYATDGTNLQTVQEMVSVIQSAVR